MIGGRGTGDVEETHMKLWYQSMSRQTEWGGYPRVLREILDKVRDPDTDIHVAGITEIGGVGDQFRYLEYLETGEVLKNVQRAVRDGFDAFLIGNIADPGLREAREIADIPVLGLCESAMHMACMMGANFSFVTINEKFTPRIIENVDRYGLRARFAGANRMRIERITDLGPGFDNADAQARILAQFNEAARKNSDAGAEVVIAAGGVVMALLAHAGVYETEDGVPILNGITNLVKLGEAAVKLNRIMGGRFTSKKCVYAPPPPDQIEMFRKHYGADIYPTVKVPSA
jgi:allantoin racemase